MEKKILISSLKETAKSSFISETKMRTWLGLGQGKTRDFLAGLEKVEGKYFIPDVADRVLERSIR